MLLSFKRAFQTATCSEAERTAECFRPQLRYTEWIRLLTPVVLCCLTSKADARPPRAWGSSYFTLWVKTAESSHKWKNALSPPIREENPVLEGRNPFRFSALPSREQHSPREHLATQVKGLVYPAGQKTRVRLRRLRPEFWHPCFSIFLKNTHQKKTTKCNQQQKQPWGDFRLKSIIG